MAEYIEREAVLNNRPEGRNVGQIGKEEYNKGWNDCRHAFCECICEEPAADVVAVVSGYHEGDICIYGFGHENKSRAIVEIVRILNDERGVAEVKFHKVFVDDTGNGYFNYLLKSGNTMNASFQYLKNITPRTDGE